MSAAATLGPERCEGLRAELETVAASTASALRADIDRARELLREAARELDAVFTRMRAASAEQQQALLAALRDPESEAPSQGNARDFLESAVRDSAERAQARSHESERMSARISEIRAAMDRISASTLQSEKIAKQTTLLSINAQIEAEQAGQHGLGFAVVAREVKELSRTSREFNRQIAQVIQSTVSSIDDARSEIAEVAAQDRSRAQSSQQKLAVLAAVHARTEVAVTRVAELTQNIAADVDVAVRELQFEDIVSQVLASAAQRLEKLSGAFASASGGGREEDLARELTSLRGAASRGATIASQTSLAEGAIELFDCGSAAAKAAEAIP